jgi:hypothetical protein
MWRTREVQACLRAIRTDHRPAVAIAVYFPLVRIRRRADLVDLCLHDLRRFLRASWYSRRGALARAAVSEPSIRPLRFLWTCVRVVTANGRNGRRADHDPGRGVDHDHHPQQQHPARLDRRIVGAGGEYMFAPRWTVKFEYDHIDLGTQTLSSNVDFGTVAPVLTGVTVLRDHRTTIDVGKFGVNYLFGGGPIIASY